jgi:hypothetical protein
VIYGVGDQNCGAGGMPEASVVAVEKAGGPAASFMGEWRGVTSLHERRRAPRPGKNSHKQGML